MFTMFLGSCGEAVTSFASEAFSEDETDAKLSITLTERIQETDET